MSDLSDLNADYSVTCYTGAVRMQSELSAAFNLVAPKDNWKNRIDCEVSRAMADRNLLVDAVVHFTGSIPCVTPVGLGEFRVEADGYYAACGA